MNVEEGNERTAAASSESGLAISEFEARLLAGWSEAGWTAAHVLLAVSGGADSVAMLRAMQRLKAKSGGEGRLFVAHLDHGLRGAESAEDATWLAELCRALELPLTVSTADIPTLTVTQGDGWEAAARAARYQFLRETAERIGARYVATAHTADDQVETVLQRILRGTGVVGLAGIPASRELSPSVALVRPMLRIRRSQVLEYLAQLGQKFRCDVSNADPRFTRNRVRHELLPVLREKFNADVDAALLRLAEQSREQQEVVAKLAADIVEKCVSVEFAQPERSGGGKSRECDQAEVCTAARAVVNSDRLRSQPKAVVCEVFRQVWRRANWPEQSMGYNEWRLLASIAAGDGPSATANLPGNIVVRRGGSRVVCERLGLP
jgi:tRNA(Ile)-lysidine synthase